MMHRYQGNYPNHQSDRHHNHLRSHHHLRQQQHNLDSNNNNNIQQQHFPCSRLPSMVYNNSILLQQQQQNHHTNSLKMTTLYQQPTNMSNNKAPAMNNCYEQKCLCCPYGFHIDLDFVRYMESLRRDVSARNQSPLRVKVMTNRDRLKFSSKERSAFSEDESTFVLRNYTLEERRPDSACANLSGPLRPYVVKPKAEPDVLVAIPDELKTLRTELFLDPEIEKKFRASTQLFIDDKNQQQQEQSNKFVEVDMAYNSGSSGDVIAKLRQTTEQRQPSGLPPLTRYRSSISVVIEQLEQCLGASSLCPVSSKFDQINNSSHSEREEDANQLTKVQTLCSKIISKLRRLHELEDRVRLIPDLDDHILSLTRQLDQLKMRQHQQKPGSDESSTKARRCVTTRDVGVGNAVLLPRSPTGFSTTTPSSIKKFADISASSLPPQPPPSSSTLKKVREVSIQVTPPNVAQNINKTSEKKLYMNHGSNNSNDMMKADKKNLSEGDHKFCCTKCGSTEVAKLQSDVENIERGVTKIIQSVDRPFQLLGISRETMATHDSPESMRNAKKVPPVIAPKPKVFQKSLVDPDIIHVGRQNGVHLLEDGLKFYEVKDKLRGDFKTSIECNEAVDETRVACLKNRVTDEFRNVECRSQPNVSIDNHQTFLNKPSITTTTKESSQTTRSSMVCQSSGKVFTVEVTPPSMSSVVPVVIDLLESSSESEEMEKELMVKLKSEGQVISVQSLNDSLSKVHSGIVQRSSTIQHPTMVNYSSECLISEITIEENFDGDRGGSSDDTLLAEPLACDVIFKNVETSNDICDRATDVSKQDAWMASVADRILEEARREAASICIDLAVIPETTASQLLQSTEAVLLTHGDHRDPLESLTFASYELSRYERESDEKIKQTQVKSSVIPATPPSSPSLSSSSSSSSSSSFPLKLFSSLHAPIVPNSSLATLEDHNETMGDDHASLMLSNISDISMEVKKNLFAETLTTDVLLTTTSESSEAENWNESNGIDRSPDKDSAVLFANSHKLFLKAAAGKMGALSDPGDLWKNKSISSELTATTNTTTDDDDYCSSSSAAEVVMPKKSRLLDSDELSAIQEDKTSGSSLGTTEEQTPFSEMDAKIYGSPDSTIMLKESLLSSKATASDTIVVTLRSQDKTISSVKVRPNSSGAFESESLEFTPLESSAITSQSLDTGISEELATIRNPCKLVLLKNEVPTIKINFVPSLSGAATPLSLGLSSDLSIFEDEEPCADDDDDDDANDVVNADDVEGGDDDDDDDGDDEEFKSSTETTDVAETSVAMTTTAEEIGTTGACSLTTGDDGFNLRMIPEDEEDCFLEACVIYANWLTDPTSITDSEKEAIVELIRKDWFLTSGRKMSQGSEVRSALLTMRNFGDLFVESVVNMADADGNTTLHYAVSHGNGQVIEALLEVGLCDVDKQNNAGYTPVMLSALLIEDVPRNFELLKTLFESGDINAASDRSGQTALMLASSHGREEMVGLLLECGSDVNIQDEDGSTALMCASEHGHVDIIKMLLAHPDCNSSLADIDGSTALSIAMEEGNHDIGILIYAHMKVHGAIEDEDQEPSV